MSASFYGTGYSAGNSNDPGLAVVPRFYGKRQTSRPVLLVPGHAASSALCAAEYADLTNTPHQAALARALADAGFACFAPNADGNTWGNDTAITRIGEAKSYLQSTLGAQSGPVALVGISMGAGAMMAWARANKASVACIVGILPVSDLGDIVTNNRSGLASNVNAAYSGVYSDATYGATHNPTKFASQLAGIPAQFWYATDDTTVIPSTVTGVASAIGGVDLHTITGGHTDTAVGAVNVSAVAAFLAAH